MMNTSVQSLFSANLSGEESSDDDEDDHFLSPFASLRNQNPKKEKTIKKDMPPPQDYYYFRESTQQRKNTLAPAMYRDDDDEEANSATLPYHIALNKSMEQQQSFNDNSFVNERSSLLGSSKRRKRGAPTPIHPLWDDDHSSKGESSKVKSACCSCTRCQPGDRNWLVIISFLHLSAMSLLDGFMWYVSFRLGSSRSSGMKWPWGAPSSSTLIRFGAFVPYNAIQYNQYWRFITSCAMSTSWMEWILIFVSWYYALSQQDGRIRPQQEVSLKSDSQQKEQRHKSKRRWRIFFLYLGSTLSGFLFVMAWGKGSKSVGGASLGTSGVLSAQVIESPRRRFIALCMSVLLLIYDFVCPFNSVWGGTGSAAFGLLCYYGLVFKQQDKTKKNSTCCYQWSSVLMLLALWVVPIMWIAFFGTIH